MKRYPTIVAKTPGGLRLHPTPDQSVEEVGRALGRFRAERDAYRVLLEEIFEAAKWSDTHLYHATRIAEEAVKKMDTSP